MVILLLGCVPNLVPPNLVENPDGDFDGDGYTENEGDCDDAAAEASPDGVEVCGDGLDNDCDGESGGCTLEGEISVTTGFRIEVRDDDADGGWSLAGVPDLDEDGVNELVVGLPGYENGTIEDAGAFLILGGPIDDDVTRGAGSWQLDLSTYSRMGTVVGDAGDFDGDGQSDVLCTIPYFEGGSVAVWVDVFESSTYRYTDGQDSGDALGAAAVAVGDQDGDGKDDILAGAPGANGGDGALVLVYGTDRSARADTSVIDGASGALGTAVAAPGDLDGDGIGDLAGAAPEGDGTVYVFAGPFDVGIGLDELVELEGAGGEQLGSALAGAGDVDGDGLADLAIGAPGLDDGDGAVYVYIQPLDGMDTPWATLTGGGREAAGAALALADDYDGDGNPDLAVGAPASDSAATDSGAVYLFGALSAGTSPLTAATARFLGEAAGDQAGHAVVGLGDVTGDGYPDLGIGAPYADSSGIEIGATYVIPGLGGY